MTLDQKAVNTQLTISHRRLARRIARYSGHDIVCLLVVAVDCDLTGALEVRVQTRMQCKDVD